MKTMNMKTTHIAGSIDALMAALAEFKPEHQPGDDYVSFPIDDEETICVSLGDDQPGEWPYYVTYCVWSIGTYSTPPDSTDYDMGGLANERLVVAVVRDLIASSREEYLG